MASPSNLAGIDHFIVLMMENRSFDHVLGEICRANGGLSGKESNYWDPTAGGASAAPAPATQPVMPFDPPHEYPDVQVQMGGPFALANIPPLTIPAQGGFLYAARHPSDGSPDPGIPAAAHVMDYFTAAQLPVISTLVANFAVANAWFSSLPGPTFPNRFFIHAATSGGLTESPDELQIIGGYSFPHGTIYDALDAKGGGLNWRIYHDGMPQSVALTDLRADYLLNFNSHYSEMKNFASDVENGRLPNYVFIEPKYDTGNNYINGNSMHPLNDIRNGEGLIRDVYNSLVGSGYWQNTMLIICFDEHGGFFDHVPPPPAPPTGDDSRYVAPRRNFGFDRYGIRTPAIVVSAYTSPGLVLDGLAVPGLIFDHTSVLATVEQRFGLLPLTGRDRLAQTLVPALNLGIARTDMPAKMPDPALDGAFSAWPVPGAPVPAAAGPPSKNQACFVALATACNLAMTNPANHGAVWDSHYRALQSRPAAAAYIAGIERRVVANRR